MPTPAMATFDAVLDAAEHLPADQQAELLQVLQRRLAARGRQRVVADVAQARAEFAAGGARAATVDQLLGEAAP